MTKKVEKEIVRTEPDQVIVGIRADEDPPLADEQYPTTGLNAHDKRDRIMKMRTALSDGLGNTPFGKMRFTDRDAYYLLKKEEAAKAAAFQDWFARMYDRATPSQKKLAREMFPTFYQQRIEALDTNLETLRKLVRIRIRGVESKEDLALQYAAENGLINMVLLEDILHPDGDETVSRVVFERGLFNPNTRFFSAELLNTPEENLAAYRGRASEITENYPLGPPRFNDETANGISAAGYARSFIG